MNVSTGNTYKHTNSSKLTIKKNLKKKAGKELDWNKVLFIVFWKVWGDSKGSFLTRQKESDS